AVRREIPKLLGIAERTHVLYLGQGGFSQRIRNAYLTRARNFNAYLGSNNSYRVLTRLSQAPCKRGSGQPCAFCSERAPTSGQGILRSSKRRDRKERIGGVQKLVVRRGPIIPGA